jgi:lipopolysaccharide biosynthesis glycosyltransferase
MSQASGYLESGSMHRPNGSRSRGHVLMCCDCGYFQHLAVCLTSLLESNRSIDVEAVVLVTGFAAESAEKLTRSLDRHPNLTLRLVDFDASRLAGLPLINAYPPEIYARFWVEDYFAADVEKVLYLDADMVIVGSLEELLTLPMGNKVLAAVSIPGSPRPAVLGYDAADEYFNSGVMVINLKRWREIGAREMLIAQTALIADKLNDPDQDVLNYCFHDQRIRLDYTWNAITPFFREINDLPLSKEDVSRVARDARIVHFNGSSKPWQYLCQHPFAEEYRRCLKYTEWRDFRPADYNLLNVFKRRISRGLGERRLAAIQKVLRGR